jgi:hypothetical protein
MERERERKFPEFANIDKNNVPNINRVSIQIIGSRWQRYSNHSSVGREIQLGFHSEAHDGFEDQGGGQGRCFEALDF